MSFANTISTQKCGIYRCPQKRRRDGRFWLSVRRVEWLLIGYKLAPSMAPWASGVDCQNIFFQMGLHIFSNSDKDFYSENNNVSQVYT
jgi:hypothetical protein